MRRNSKCSRQRRNPNRSPNRCGSPRRLSTAISPAAADCLIVADGFYEFTQPADPKKKRKDKWLFTKRGEKWFCIAGIWRKNATVGEAFTMLTMAPGPDIAPYHDRQIAILDRAQWADWLDPAVPAKAVLKPLPKGTLAVEQVG